MRDRQKYIDAGRNDPGTDQQMREHPYDFVSLPDHPQKGDAIVHDRFFPDRWSGTITLIYKTETPLHIGSGFFELGTECGLTDPGPVRGIMRSVDGPILPGSSWKGAIRSRFEAITGSRLALASTEASVEASKVPRELRAKSRTQTFEIRDPKIKALKAATVNEEGTNLKDFSPAEALFGCPGYAGRVMPNEGRIVGGKATRALPAPPLDSPQMHRLAKPGNLSKGSSIITEVEGRKFYYDGGHVPSRRSGNREVFELIDHITAGAMIHVDVRVRNISIEELGALLIAAGQGRDVGIVRFGGYKPAGFGKVSVFETKLQLRHGGPWTTQALDPPSPESAITEARNDLIHLPALRELHRVTTAWRPAE